MNGDNNTTRSGLLMAVSAYLVYLGVSILTKLGEADDVSPVLLGICAVVFIVAGAAYFIYQLKLLIKAKRDAENAPDNEQQEDETPEEIGSDETSSDNEAL